MLPQASGVIVTLLHILRTIRVSGVVLAVINYGNRRYTVMAERGQAHVLIFPETDQVIIEHLSSSSFRDKVVDLDLIGDLNLLIRDKLIGTISSTHSRQLVQCVLVDNKVHVL